MKLIFESPYTIPSISQAFSNLTDKSRICVDDIRYNKEDGIVELLMQRKELIGFRKSFLRVPQPVYGQTMIDGILTIKEVVGMDIKLDDRLESECNSCFTVLFGLNIDGNDLYLGSAEETQGNALCQVLIKVKHLNIEYVDKEKNNIY